ncbi:MAG: Uncharacterized protein Athens101428_793, partial [Candidatus Berkelbacteria bacterium Athens1014_28]
MLIEFSKIIKLPIYELKTQQKVGRFFDFFVSDDDGTIEAAIAKPAGFFSKLKFVSKKEIVEISKVAIIVQNEDSLVDSSELVRLHKKEKSRPKIIGARVVTKNNDYLGRVYDYVLDSLTLTIVRLYAAKLWDQRIIPASSIVKIEKNKIIV